MNLWIEDNRGAWIGYVLRLILNWIFGVKMPFLSCRFCWKILIEYLFLNYRKLPLFYRLGTFFLPLFYRFSTAFLPLFYDIIFDPVCQLSVNHKWMLDMFTENYCIFTVWLLFCSTSPFEIFAMCFFSGPECILKCCSMFARNFDLQSFQKIFNHYWQILNYKKVYLKKEKKKWLLERRRSCWRCLLYRGFMQVY